MALATTFDDLYPCNLHVKPAICDDKCENRRKKVTFHIKETEEVEHFITMTPHQARCVWPALACQEHEPHEKCVDTCIKFDLESDENHSSPINTKKDIFLRYCNLCFINAQRRFPSLPFGMEKMDPLKLTALDTYYLANFTCEELCKIIELSIFLDKFNIARLCTQYLVNNFMADRPIAEVQKDFDMSNSIEPSGTYQRALDRYALNSYVFHPDREEIASFNQFNEFIGSVSSSDGVISNWSGTTCIGWPCVAEYAYLKRDSSEL